jgi:hypothetical protein
MVTGLLIGLNLRRFAYNVTFTVDEISAFCNSEAPFDFVVDLVRVLLARFSSPLQWSLFGQRNHDIKSRDSQTKTAEQMVSAG